MCVFDERNSGGLCDRALRRVLCARARLAHLLGVTALVGVVLDGSLAIRLLDLSRVRGLAHAKDVVKLVAVTLFRLRVVFFCVCVGGGGGGAVRGDFTLTQEKRGRGGVVLSCE